MTSGHMSQLDLPVREVGANELITSAEPSCITIGAHSDATTEQLMRIVEGSGALDFWDRTGEDVYSMDDGEPV